jgi:hypothetical protein
MQSKSIAKMVTIVDQSFLFANVELRCNSLMSLKITLYSPLYLSYLSTRFKNVGPGKFGKKEKMHKMWTFGEKSKNRALKKLEKIYTYGLEI